MDKSASRLPGNKKLWKMAQIPAHWTLIGPDQVHFYISQVQHIFIHLKGQTCVTYCVCVYSMSVCRDIDRHTQVFFDNVNMRMQKMLIKRLVSV